MIISTRWTLNFKTNLLRI